MLGSCSATLAAGKRRLVRGQVRLHRVVDREDALDVPSPGLAEVAPTVVAKELAEAFLEPPLGCLVAELGRESVRIAEAENRAAMSGRLDERGREPLARGRVDQD